MPSQDLAPGTRVGRYGISRVLERGAQEVTCEGVHLALRYRVTIRVVRVQASEERRALVRREAQLGAALQHRHILQVLEAGELPDGSLYLVTEHVDGCSLAKVVAHRRLSADATVDLGVQVLAALTAVSAHGIVHGDITSESIVLERAADGQVTAKLIGFGVCKAIRADLAESMRGARAEQPDARIDSYALAAVLYEALSGRPPRAGRRATKDGNVRPLRDVAAHVPREVASVVDRALARDPDDRWRHPAEMAEALRAAAQRLGLARGADAWAEVIANGLGSSTNVVSSPRERSSQDTRPAARERGWSSSARATFGRWVAPAVAIGLCVFAATELVTGSYDHPLDKLADAAEKLVVDPAVTTPTDASEPESRSEPPAPQREPTAPPRIEEPSLDELESGARDMFVRGEAAAAMDVYRRVIDRSPRRATAWRGLGLVAAASGDHARARRALHRYLELAPRSPDRPRIERELERLR